MSGGKVDITSGIPPAPSTPNNTSEFSAVAFIPGPADTQGTTGDDAFVLTYTGVAATGSVHIKASTNGGSFVELGTFPTNSPLTLDGLGGTDSVRIEGTAAADVITVTGTSLAINGAGLILSSIESRTLAALGGNDTYRFDADSPLGLFTLEESGGGVDTLDFSLTTTVGVTANLGLAATQVIHPTNLRLQLNPGGVFENAIGGSGNDTLIGNWLANALTGGAGNDTMYGGQGDDRYWFGTATSAESDVVSEYFNQGTDTLIFSALTTDVNLRLGSNAIQNVHTNRTLKLISGGTFENAVGGSGNDTLFGNSLANILTGNSGNDILVGNSGNDTLY